jgi:hypothetical protein
MKCELHNRDIQQFDNCITLNYWNYNMNWEINPDGAPECIVCRVLHVLEFYNQFEVRHSNYGTIYAQSLPAGLQCVYSLIP